MPKNGEVAYLDTSAIVKLVMVEAETVALRRWLRRWPRRASSALLRVELPRAAKRAGQPRLVEASRQYLESLHLIRLDDSLLDRAAELDPPSLRTLDAIHLGAARSLGAELGMLVTYDARMLAAAQALGLPAAAPV